MPVLLLGYEGIVRSARVVCVQAMFLKIAKDRLCKPGVSHWQFEDDGATARCVGSTDAEAGEVAP